MPGHTPADADTPFRRAVRVKKQRLFHFDHHRIPAAAIAAPALTQTMNDTPRSPRMLGQRPQGDARDPGRDTTRTLAQRLHTPIVVVVTRSDR